MEEVIALKAGAEAVEGLAGLTNPEANRVDRLPQRPHPLRHRRACRWRGFAWGRTRRKEIPRIATSSVMINPVGEPDGVEHLPGQVQLGFAQPTTQLLYSMTTTMIIIIITILFFQKMGGCY